VTEADRRIGARSRLINMLSAVSAEDAEE